MYITKICANNKLIKLVSVRFNFRKRNNKPSLSLKFSLVKVTFTNDLKNKKKSKLIRTTHYWFTY